MRNRRNQYTNDTVRCLASLAFIAAVAAIGGGCTTTRTLTNTAAGTTTSTQTTAMGGLYSNTEVVQQSREQYTQCLQTRGAQPNAIWTDNQRECFGQTTIGQTAAGMYGYGSNQFYGYMNYWGNQFVPGWNTLPMPTANPNVLMANGRPVLIPVGANVNQGWAGPQAAYATIAMDDLVRRAGVANQAAWPVTTPSAQPSSTTQSTRNTEPLVIREATITQAQWDALMRQVATLSARRTR